ncbi:MotA/TolQ/ExbB proton channel family protein [Thalassoglobus polymorphus]|uniref:Colicin uptake protein TolQ n=1 Tax=Thalassoglobus polymorphus TaxID=2527994 RepID=A0A517QTV8_9PLAN|nr:MotA/TolQ/ExbB proton channel family protein [Thalassoglobus polymorphus]QDT35075.1 colicin uptake protein TolQ [Thalassoglobus polymorphus]
MNQLLVVAGPVIYVAMALAALYGVFCAVLLFRKISQKRFSSASQSGEFLDEVRDKLYRRDFDGIVELCDSPPYWSKALAQMILVALAHRDRGLSKLRILLAEKYERDVLADLEYRFSWIGTIVKTAPMLGLLGTVSGMILAFGKIAGSGESGVNPADLADDISFALLTTACGLMIAIPLTMLGAAVQVKKGKMTDAVQEDLSEFLHDLEKVMAEG